MLVSGNFGTMTAMKIPMPVNKSSSFNVTVHFRGSFQQFIKTITVRLPNSNRRIPILEYIRFSMPDIHEFPCYDGIILTVCSDLLYVVSEWHNTGINSCRSIRIRLQAWNYFRDNMSDMFM